MRNKYPGLYQRGSIWHINKTVKVACRKESIRESTQTCHHDVAVQIYMRRIQEVTQRLLYGASEPHTFAEVAAKILETPGRNHADDVYHLDMLMPYIGDTYIHELHSEHPLVSQFIADRIASGRSNNTINRSLEKVSLALHMATRLREPDHTTPWLPVAPVIHRLKRKGDKRNPGGCEATGYPLGLTQEKTLFALLSKKVVYHDMAKLALYSGMCESEVVSLTTEQCMVVGDLWWLGLPPRKESGARRVPLNSMTRTIVQTYVDRQKQRLFPYQSINNNFWQRCIADAGLRDVRGQGKHFRVHDLRTTFATRLLDVGVPWEAIKDLLGHRRGADVTQVYALPQLHRLAEYSERMVSLEESPELYAHADINHTQITKQTEGTSNDEKQ